MFPVSNGGVSVGANLATERRKENEMNGKRAYEIAEEKISIIRHDNPIITDVVMAEFLSKLEALMAEYKVSKVDISWNHFRPTK